MFTLFSLRKSYQINTLEFEALIKVLEIYSETKAGQWLEELPFKIFKYRYCFSMVDSDIMGAFVPIIPKTIFLMPPVDVEHSVIWIEIIASTVIHELRHAWQFRKRPLWYILGSLPILREFALERDAKKITREADRIVENILADFAAQKFEERRKQWDLSQI